MVLLRALGYLLAYVVAVGLLVLLNTELLSLGELELIPHPGYFLIWVTFFSPLAVLGAMVASWRPDRITPSIHRRLLQIYLVLTLVSLELSAVLDATWHWLVAETLVGGLLFVLIRSRMTETHRRGASGDDTVEP